MRSPFFSIALSVSSHFQFRVWTRHRTKTNLVAMTLANTQIIRSMTKITGGRDDTRRFRPDMGLLVTL